MIGNGSLKIVLRSGEYFTIWGGPSRSALPSLTYARVAAEVTMPSVVSMDIPDFSVPAKRQVDEFLGGVVPMILTGEPIYVGCMGGFGRTGMALALICRAFGIKRAVNYVRKNYHPSAVETHAQEQFVSHYKVTDLVKDRVENFQLFSLARANRSLTLSPYAHKFDNESVLLGKLLAFDLNS